MASRSGRWWRRRLGPGWGRVAVLVLVLVQGVWLSGMGEAASPRSLAPTAPTADASGEGVAATWTTRAALARGRQRLEQYQCGACHRIEGVAGAGGSLGPPLVGLGGRSYLAGRVPNVGDALVRWIVDPQALVPGTSMPALGVSVAHARDMADYLRALR